MSGGNGQRTGQGNAQNAAVESGMTRTARNAEREELTQERLRELMTYDPETGNFIRIQQTGRGHRKRPGVCGYLRPSDGYLEIKVDQRKYRAHHLVWLWHYGELPTLLDHINGNILDNRIENLRRATVKQNGFNRSAVKRNPTGYKGVSWHSIGRKWRARIRVDGKEKNLGLFGCPKEAAKAYDNAARDIHGEFMKPNIDEFGDL